VAGRGTDRRPWTAGLAAGALAAAAVLTLQAERGAEVRLTDVTREAGVSFVHQNGAAGKKLLPETLGSGSAFLDVDNDGHQDLVFVHGVLPGRGGVGQAGRWATIYRNTGGGGFTDVTAAMGLEVAATTGKSAGPDPGSMAPVYGMGIAAADFDNDGWTDLAITSVGGVRLFRNVEGRRFEDVTAASGLADRRGFSTCVMWVDHDRDGLVDLFVCNYVQWTPETDLFCSADGREKTYCTPQAYRGSTSWLFRNLGGGRFEDVTARAGLFDVTNKSLGVTLLDHDLDGWPDLFVANDTVPNRLYRNNQNGTFTELGLQSGLAFSADGRARAGMGVDAAEIDGSGRPSVAVTNFSNEMVGLYVPRDQGFYVDAAPQSDVGRVTRQTLGWGCFFFDVNLDGALDLLVVNGHLDSELARGQGQTARALPPHLFLNGGGRFEDIAARVGGGFADPKVGRGAAFADIDGDGDLDFVVTTNGGPAILYRNDTPAGHGAVRLLLRGTRSNRDAIGAQVTGKVAGQRISRRVRTGSSYLSQSELIVTFGLGATAQLDDVVVTWPVGQQERLGALTAGARYDVVEGRGVTGRVPFAPR
jgi:enediyne biosynthesis protein E4